MLAVVVAVLVLGSAQQVSAPAARAAVPDFTSIYPNWRPICDAAGISGHRIVFDVEIDARGRIVGEPVLVRPRDDADWRAAAEVAREALVRSAPFDVPANFRGGRYRPTFVTERVCADRAEADDT